MTAQKAVQNTKEKCSFSPRYNSDSSQPLNIPVNLALNTVGLDIMNIRDAHKETASSGYEIQLKEYKPELIQKLMVQNCLHRIDISLDDIRTSRKEILDLTKLVLFSQLYNQFRRENFEITVSSPLILQWNRQNPRKQIDSHSDQSLMRMEDTLIKRSDEVNLFRQEIMKKLWADHNYLFRGDDDHQKRMGMAGKLLSHIHPFTQTVLLDYAKIEDVKTLRSRIIDKIALYLKRYCLPEYNALVLLEYLQCSERENLTALYRKIMESNGREISEFPMNGMIRKELIRRKISPRSRFSFLFENRNSQTRGIISRVRMVVLSSEREIRRVNDILFNRKTTLTLKKSIKTI